MYGAPPFLPDGGYTSEDAYGAPPLEDSELAVADVHAGSVDAGDSSVEDAGIDAVADGVAPEGATDAGE